MIHFISNQISFDDLAITHHTHTSALSAFIAEVLGDGRDVAVDTETTGLNFLDDTLLLLQIGDEQDQWVIDCTTIDARIVAPVLESRKILKLFHNVKFDYKFIRSKLGITCENVYDCMLAEQVIHCGKTSLRNSLAAIAERRLKLSMSKDERGSFINHRGVFRPGQVVYGAKDLVPLFGIRDSQKTDIDKLGLSNVVKLENHAALAFADIEYNGIQIDETAWLQNAKRVTSEVQHVKKLLYDALEAEPRFVSFLPRYNQLSLFADAQESARTGLESHFSFDSPKQMKELLWTLDPTLTSVDSKLLERLTKLHPIIGVYLTYKKADKLVSTYGESFLSQRWSDGKIHVSVKQILNTGRISTSGPSMQNLPAVNAYRNCFTAPQGWVYVSSDFKSQELAITAERSGDPVWINALRAGKDLHSVCAEVIYGDLWRDAAESTCEYYYAHVDKDGVHHPEDSNLKCECKGHGKLRKRSKAINLGLCYGMTEYKLSADLQISIDEAKALIGLYFRSFPSIKRFLDGLGRTGTSTGMSRTFPPYSRIRHYEGWEYKRRDQKFMGEVERASKNSPIQGSASEMIKESLIVIRRRILDGDLPVRIVMTVHDQIDTICEADYASMWKTELTAIMEAAARRILPSGLLKAETSVTPVWSK